MFGLTVFSCVQVSMNYAITLNLITGELCRLAEYSMTAVHVPTGATIGHLCELSCFDVHVHKPQTV